jgi:hypothetical protein
MTLGQLLFELRATHKGNWRTNRWTQVPLGMYWRTDGWTRVNLNAPPYSGGTKIHVFVLNLTSPVGSLGCNPSALIQYILMTQSSGSLDGTLPRTFTGISSLGSDGSGYTLNAPWKYKWAASRQNQHNVVKISPTQLYCLRKTNLLRSDLPLTVQRSLPPRSDISDFLIFYIF